MGAELFHAEGQTDTTELKSAFPNSVNAPKNAPRHIPWLPHEF